ncbi:MAG TPA: hypothetical protein VGN14_02325 [Candidatus Elarobacter sp.]
MAERVYAIHVMQQTLPRPAGKSNWLHAAFARLSELGKRLNPEPQFGDIKFTDALERELANSEFRRWR